MILFGLLRLFCIILHVCFPTGTLPLFKCLGSLPIYFGLAKHAIITNFLIKLCILIVYMHLYAFINSLVTNKRCVNFGWLFAWQCGGKFKITWSPRGHKYHWDPYFGPISWSATRQDTLELSTAYVHKVHRFILFHAQPLNSEQIVEDRAVWHSQN